MATPDELGVDPNEHLAVYSWKISRRDDGWHLETKGVLLSGEWVTLRKNYDTLDEILTFIRSLAED